MDEGISQLHRYLFLRAVWSTIVPENDDGWIDQDIADANNRPTDPFAGVGHALRRRLAAGASRADLIDLVRGKQAEVAFRVCNLLDDPSIAEPELDTLGWCIVETDEEGEPTDRVIGGLHESVLDTDPTGREMRPRDTR